uniref:Dynein heavy chain linker domain-containing protein n=1 Tax=Panagrolaimus davidi TaxID=227884 RepID=A0A914PW30_9BILA
MLSKGRDPKQVEPYLSKLFASISKPEFNNRGEIIAIFASNNERLELRRPVNVNLAKRHVDKWLLELEKEMKLTIHSLIKELLQKFEFEFVKLEDLIESGAVDQIILAHFKLVFTHKAENAIIHGNLKASFFEL